MQSYTMFEWKKKEILRRMQFVCASYEMRARTCTEETTTTTKIAKELEKELITKRK